MFRLGYWLFAYLGMMVVWASFVMGFRYSPEAPAVNVLWNILLYGAFIAVHIAMTMPEVKRTLFGERAGTAFERRVYISVTIVTWIALNWLHWPTGGFAWAAPAWLRYVGLCAYLLCLVAFFQTTRFEDLAGFVGMPGSELSYSVGSETPLLTDGPYAKVRHPMYLAAIVGYFVSLLMHPQAGQLLFALMLSATFVAFVPFEEHQLIRGRGDAYRAYMTRTPYRILPGVW